MAKNIKIRVALAESGIKQYEVAEALGIAEETLSRKLRHELLEDEQRKVLEVIDRLKK